jgi:endogenous inhibitor of DNA gyrase (YacG/DUF329 family)
MYKKETSVREREEKNLFPFCVGVAQRVSVVRWIATN